MSDLVTISACWKCGQPYAIPRELYTAAKASENIGFYCPYGHRAVYPAGETQADILRRERDRLAQRIAEKDDEIARQREFREAAERSVAAQKGQITKLKRRAAAGVCPCCNRQFQDLYRHITTKHPDFAESNVVQIKREAAA